MKLFKELKQKIMITLRVTKRIFLIVIGFHPSLYEIELFNLVGYKCPQMGFL